MVCEAVVHSLVDYLKGELRDGEQEAVEAHLHVCAACRRERDVLEKTFITLRRELVPIELSAHFRLALAQRLEDATNADGAPKASAPAAMRQSERHIRAMKEPVLRRLWAHARRSPYFVLSLGLHAAALLVICAILLKMQAAATSPVVIGPEEPDGAGVREVRIDPARAAWHVRREARHFDARAGDADGGVEVDLALSCDLRLADATLVLVGDHLLGCLRGYIADPEQGRSIETLSAAHKGSVAQRVSDYQVFIPSPLTRLFGASRDLVVFCLQDRVEFWSRPTWNALSRSCSLAQIPASPAVLADRFAILPRSRGFASGPLPLAAARA